MFYEFRLFLNTILTVAKLRMTSVHVIPITVSIRQSHAPFHVSWQSFAVPVGYKKSHWISKVKSAAYFTVSIFFMPVSGVLRRRYAAACLLRLWVRIPPGAWMSVLSVVCCKGRGLCDELITRPEETYRLWCVVVCDLETSWMRRPWPIGGCYVKDKTKYSLR
jgi:hypothetical protein